MKKSTKVRISPLTWVFLVFAVIMAIMAIYFCQDAVKYVTEYAESYGITVKDMGSDATKYIMNAFFPYLVYTLIMLGFAAAMYEISKLRASLYEEPDDLDYAAAAALADEAVEDAAFDAAEAEAVVCEAEEAVCEAEKVVCEAEEAVCEAEEVVCEAEEAATEATCDAAEAAKPKKKSSLWKQKSSLRKGSGAPKKQKDAKKKSSRQKR